MKNPPAPAVLKRVPKLNATETISGEDKIIHLHFFIGGCDWYIAEYDGKDTFFGYANLNDSYNAEWGYVGFNELKEITIGVDFIDHRTGEKMGNLPVAVEWDEQWQSQPFGKIENP